MTNMAQPRQPAGTPTGGQFATDARDEVENDLPSPTTDNSDAEEFSTHATFREAVERMVAHRELSPAALDMKPFEAFNQHAAANALTLDERQELVEAYGGDLFPIHTEEFEEGDLIDLEPIVCEFGLGSPGFEEDLNVAQYELATIEEVTYDDGATVLHTDQGSWAVPTGRAFLGRLGR